MNKFAYILFALSLSAGCAQTTIIERPVYVNTRTIVEKQTIDKGLIGNNNSHCAPFPHPDSDLHKIEERIRRDLAQIGASEDTIRREILKTRSQGCGN